MTRFCFALTAILVLGLSASFAADPATAPAPSTAIAPQIDITKLGTYSAEQWEYRLTVTAPGTKSEGYRGQLLFAGKVVDEPVKFDYYHTPWGDLQWVGMPATPWGEHGWFLRPAKATGGKLLKEPYLESGAPVVKAMILVESDKPAKLSSADTWISDGMNKAGVKSFAIERNWFVFNDQAIIICDTKLQGTLRARLLPLRSSNSFTIDFEGTIPSFEDLPRVDGATKVVVRKLATAVSTSNFYIAFRVEKAATEWPKPAEIGEDANGKEVTVSGAREVAVSLPASAGSGNIWVVTKIQGEDPLGASSIVRAGEPQFTTVDPSKPDGKGVIENTFKVAGTGKTDLVLEYRSNWQADEPAAKIFKVTVNVVKPGAATAPATKP